MLQRISINGAINCRVKDKQRRKESKIEAANCYNQRTKAGRASAVKSERNILGALRNLTLVTKGAMNPQRSQSPIPLHLLHVTLQPFNKPFK